LIAGPIIAHLLKRGRTRELEFPPAHLVPNVVVTSEQKRRLEDRFLLLLRALMVLALAVLGATPFVRCSHLSVDRQSGASVAMAIVLDDSQSMRAKVTDGTRFDLAMRGAEQLLASLREGDAVALVLAGKPARLALTTSTDLAAARTALETFAPSDRATALADAVQLARAAMKELPHVDKRVVVLSDLATDQLPEGDPPLWMPLESLAEAAPNCGIASAEQQGRAVVAVVGCTDRRAAQGRKLSLREAGDDGGEPFASEPLGEVEGEQRVQLNHSTQGLDLVVELSGDDRIEADDRADVAKEAVALSVAVVADASRASVMTGGATVVEQAFAALVPDAKLKPLTSVPENAEDLATHVALVVDDPPGLSPASRTAVQTWLERGGVALALLGPASTSAELAATLEPFAREGARWEAATAPRVEASSLAWLGPEAEGFSDLAIVGRVRLDAADLPGAEIVATWNDGVPLLFRRQVGRGLVFTLGLPAAIDRSDLAISPGFLVLLDLVRKEAAHRSGPRQSQAGTIWAFPADARVSIQRPRGGTLPETVSTEQAERRFVPELTGRYAVNVDGEKTWRLVELDPKELVTPPLLPSERVAVASSGSGSDSVDASREWALFVLFLFAFELATRAFGDRLRKRWALRGAT
jgi:hypothetical protein